MATERKMVFYSTVAATGQIFIGKKLIEWMGLEPGDIVRFDVEPEKPIIFSKDEKESALSHNQPKKDAADARKAAESRKKK